MQQTTDPNHWHEQFTRERERLIATLGEITDGGIVEHLEHIGTTSIPGLYGRQSIDIALAVWPFPLEESALQALALLGYEHDLHFAGPLEQLFRHSSTNIRLYVFEAGDPTWMDYLLVSEYLRHNEVARQALSACKQEYEGDAESTEYHEAKKRWFDQSLNDAHQSWIKLKHFSPLYVVTDELRDFPCPWYIGGGWALDVFLGRVTRAHQDVDVIISRADQLALQQYLTIRGWRLVTSLEGQFQPWPMHMRLELPRHQAHAHRNGLFIDFLFTDLDSGVWRYRREPTILRDITRMGLRSHEGFSFLSPELVLLFKSKTTTGKERSKDQIDFETIYTTLEPERRVWLRWALIAIDPSHPWIERL
jgi:GrpB-like predicted nucleotidyltransferase (UPF0157 family)